MPALAGKLGLLHEYIELRRRRPLLLFEITTRCNLNCLFCYSVWKNEKPYPRDELPTEQITPMLMKALRESGGSHVTFTGGEPLLRPDLEEIIAHLAQNGITSTLITNGTLLTEDRARALVKAGVGLIEMQLLAADRRVHNELAREDAFDRAVLGMADARLAGARVIPVFVATRKNLANWEETVNLCLAAGVDGLLFNRFNPGGEGARHVQELLPSAEDLKPALRVADRIVQEHQFPIGVPVPIPPCTIDHSAYPHLTFNGCLAGTANAYWTIDPTGNVRACNHSPTTFGNVRQEHFREIISRKRTGSWVSSVAQVCRGCRHVRKCRGGCKAAAQVCCGSLEECDPFVRNSRTFVEAKP